MPSRPPHRGVPPRHPGRPVARTAADARPTPGRAGVPTRPAGPPSAVRRPPYALRRTVAALAVLLVVAVAAALGLGVFSPHHGPGGGVTDTAAHGPAASAALRVGLVDCTFVDSSRATPDFATGGATPGRRLVTELRYPTTSGSTAHENVGVPAAYRRGPFPLVVFAPGYDVDPDEYRPLLDDWVRAGFVVAAPIFPDTNPVAVQRAGQGKYPEDDDASQPGDVAYVTRRVEAAARGASPNCAFVRGLVSRGPVALAGQSDGGNTVATLAYTRADASLLSGLSVKAVAVLSGSALINTNVSAYGPGPALLFTQSPHDACNPPQEALALYRQIAQGDRWFLEINSTTHIGPYNGREPVPFAAVVAATTAYFHAELDGGAVTPALRAALAGKKGAGPLLSGAAVPAMAALTPSIPACYVDVH